MIFGISTLLLLLANARLLYFIRHAEKPTHKSTFLSPLGLARSKSLYFKVDTIITQSSPVGKSKRPYLTVLPLSKQLGLQIDDECDSRDIHCAVTKIENSDGDVLVCWEHKRLGKILGKLGYEKKYPKDRFDIVWIIDTELETIKETVQQPKELQTIQETIQQPIV